MPKYKVNFHPRVYTQLEQHAEFIARVSKSAADNFRDEFSEALRRLSINPYQFPQYDDPSLPIDTYWKIVFAKWYKAVFSIEGDSVYVDAVVDGRAERLFG